MFFAVGCDDTDPGIRPGATEICDGVDQDCDGFSDDGLLFDVYLDADHDGYGDGDPGPDDAEPNAVQMCALVEGFALEFGDCDDENADIHPDADELCGGEDENCDGALDAGAVDPLAAYADSDGDGYGDPTRFVATCDIGAGYSPFGTDCDDTRAAVSPSAPEVCNGIDDNCNRLIDSDATNQTLFAVDADGDGYGDPEAEQLACELADGLSENTTDCSDNDPDIYPGVACTWRSTVTSPGPAEVYFWTPTPQDSISAGGTEFALVENGVQTLVLDDNRQLTVDAPEPFVLAIAGSSRGGDQVANFLGVDGLLSDDLFGWAGTAITLLNASERPVQTQIRRWNGAAWEAAQTVEVAGNSATEVDAPWGPYHITASQPISAVGFYIANAENHMAYWPTRDGFYTGTSWQFRVPLELREHVAMVGLCIESDGCSVRTDTGGAYVVKPFGTFYEYVSAKKTVNVTSSGAMILRDEATPNGFDTTDGSTLDADLIPAIESDEDGDTLGQKFYFATDLSTRSQYPTRQSDLTVVAYEGGTVTVDVFANDTWSAFGTYDVAPGRPTRFTDLAGNQVFRVESDVPVELLHSHEAFEFAYTQRSEYFAD